MSCLPGMPCYNMPVVKIVYPPGCDPTPLPIIGSDQVRYDGPNLSCTGVQTGDCLNTALEKIDEKICSEELVASIIQTIANNDVLKAYFCQLVNSCPVPTTTTTSSSTTTTTTTMSPNDHCVGLFGSANCCDAIVAYNESCPSPPSSTHVYSPCVPLEVGCQLYIDAAFLYPLGSEESPFSPSWMYDGLDCFYVDSLGMIDSFGSCTTTTTTTIAPLCETPVIDSVVSNGGTSVTLNWSSESEYIFIDIYKSFDGGDTYEYSSTISYPSGSTGAAVPQSQGVGTTVFYQILGGCTEESFSAFSDPVSLTI
jgi:hypothetical protein